MDVKKQQQQAETNVKKRMDSWLVEVELIIVNSELKIQKFYTFLYIWINLLHITCLLFA